MGLTRAAQSPTAIQRSCKVARLTRRGPNQMRTIWWWAKKSRGWCSQDLDGMEERLRRHQALMMHRYSKALKRAALWDRDNSPCFPVWRLRGRHLDRELSSTQPARAKVEDRDTDGGSRRAPWQEFHKDFESFKRAVDKAIARDPYGTLFGRRLRSPETTNNSSWTSWSWIFNPKDIKEEPIPEPEKPDKKSSKVPSETQVAKDAPVQPAEPKSGDAGKAQPTVTHTSSSSKTATSLTSSQSIVFQDDSQSTAEYVYDPISGRKVPQQPVIHAAPPPEPEPVGPKPQTSPQEATNTVKAETVPSEKSFMQTVFGEHGVNIPVKTYKPPKVYGYTGELKPASKPDQTASQKSQEKVETQRKREHDAMRLRAIGNNIDATNFNCEPWNNKQPETPEVADPQVDEEKHIRTSPVPNEEDAPLFSGTAYASRSEELAVRDKSDWLAKEGFRAKQGMTIPSLKESAQSAPKLESAQRMQPALDRANLTASDKAGKEFTSKLQSSVDRLATATKLPKVEGQSVPPRPAMVEGSPLEAQEKKEDIDLLRASDVRAAAKTARLTKQEIEEKRRQERLRLEKDFDTRQKVEQDSVETAPKNPTAALSSGKMDHIWQHIKSYPEGIVARVMQIMGLSNTSQREVGTKGKAEKPVPVSTATIKSEDPSDQQLQKLAADLNDIYKQGSQREVEKSAFLKPTVRPGVVRSLAIERHTMEFEPKVAQIVDKAKEITKALRDVDETYAGIQKNLSKLKPVTSQEHHIPKIDGAMPQDESTGSETPQPQLSASAASFQAPFILLNYNRNLGDVEVTPLNNLMGQQPAPETKTNAMTTIGSLNNPNAFVRHFVDLDKNGYELTHGGGDMLIFQKRRALPRQDEPPTSSSLAPTSSSLAPTSKLRINIAAAEAAAQPATQISKEAATVLDEIPSTIPMPGPAPPTAPTTSRTPQTSSETSTSTNTSAGIPLGSTSNAPQGTASSTAAAIETQQALQPPKSRSFVSRQEQVFSGQVRLPPHTTGLPDPEHFQKQNPIADTSAAYEQENISEPQPGYFARLRRGIRKIILTTLALGVGAYGVGAIAEAINTRAQIAGSDAGGPMKKLVLEDGRKQGERQRAGIFSTESSR